MLTKKLNTGIIVASRSLNFLIIVYFALLLAKFVWWVISPSLPDIYVGRISVTEFDNSVKNITNHYPFGVYTPPQEPVNVVLPAASQMKLTGLYLSDKAHSIAFIELNNEPRILKVGDLIIGGTTLKAINANNIVIEQNGNEQVISIVESAPITSTAANRFNMPNQFNRPSFVPNMNQNAQQMQPGFDQAVVNNFLQQQNEDNTNMQDRRRRVMEEFEHNERLEKSENNPNYNNR